MSVLFDEDRFPIRKSPRLKHFDYSTQAYYFVTICAKDKACLFGTPEVFSDAGLVAEICLKQMETHFPTVQLDKYVVMPNHVHAILILGKGSPALSVIVGQYKSAVTKCVHTKMPSTTVWQSSFHDHVIRSQADYERIWAYIDTNPLRWSKDCFFTP